jgi:hypothetical protein
MRPKLSGVFSNLGSLRRAQNDAIWHTPSRTSRHKAIRSLRAKATIEAPAG